METEGDPFDESLLRLGSEGTLAGYPFLCFASSSMLATIFFVLTETSIRAGNFDVYGFLELQSILSYPNFVRGPLLDDERPFFGPREVLGTHH